MNGNMRGEREEYEYTAFGDTYKGEASKSYGMAYMGKQEIAGMRGVYNYGYRDYRSVEGRFMTEDPIRDGTNWHVYVSNSPLNYIDPDGLKAGDLFDSPDAAAIPRTEDSSQFRVNDSTVAYIHSHGNEGEKYGRGDNIFSYTDITVARDMGIIAYVATPNGSLDRYDPKTDEYTDNVVTSLPYDPKSPPSSNPTDISSSNQK